MFRDISGLISPLEVSALLEVSRVAELFSSSADVCSESPSDVEVDSGSSDTPPDETLVSSGDELSLLSVLEDEVAAVSSC